MASPGSHCRRPRRSERARPSRRPGGPRPSPGPGRWPAATSATAASSGEPGRPEVEATEHDVGQGAGHLFAHRQRAPARRASLRGVGPRRTAPTGRCFARASELATRQKHRTLGNGSRGRVLHPLHGDEAGDAVRGLVIQEAGTRREPRGPSRSGHEAAMHEGHPRPVEAGPGEGPRRPRPERTLRPPGRDAPRRANSRSPRGSGRARGRERGNGRRCARPPRGGRAGASARRTPGSGP